MYIIMAICHYIPVIANVVHNCNSPVSCQMFTVSDPRCCPPPHGHSLSLDPPDAPPCAADSGQTQAPRAAHSPVWPTLASLHGALGWMDEHDSPPAFVRQPRDQCDWHAGADACRVKQKTGSSRLRRFPPVFRLTRALRPDWCGSLSLPSRSRWSRPNNANRS